LTLQSDPLVFITIECANPPRARQVARWLLAAQKDGLIPLRADVAKEDEAVGTKLFANNRRGTPRAAAISRAKRRI
jgi:hypothetical protein